MDTVTPSDNPLYSSQREKIGATTFQKYDYQYHWALYRILTEHINCNEYAVFIEFHEDVIVSDSLNNKEAKFEFSQIKTTNKVFNTKHLTSRNVEKRELSILGKLVSTCSQKEFNDRISSINLVSLKGFNLELKKSGILLNKITKEDLSENQFKELEDAIIEELSITCLPTNIQFIIPELSEKNFQNDVIATISMLVNSIFPNSRTNAIDIYRALIDELHRKGTVTYDFRMWNDLLRYKALTSITVTDVISQFTDIKSETTIDFEFNNICNELGLKAIARTNMKRAFDRYRQLRISNKSTNQIDIKNTIKNFLNLGINEGIDDFNELIIYTMNNLPIKIKQQYIDERDLKGAIICEYIMN